MRASPGSALVLAVVMLLPLGASCDDELPTGDVCADAIRLFAACGTSVPVLSDGPCSGVRAAMARCVVAQAHDCDELATLTNRLDACVGDAIDAGAVVPPELPVPSTSVTGGGGGAGGSGGAGGQQI